jgi:hypothetical protein
MGILLGLAGAFLLAVLQLAAFGLTAVKVGHAAQEAAYVAVVQDQPALAGQTPCWAVTGGLQNPGAYRDATICRSIAGNVGDLDLNRLTIHVDPENASQRAGSIIHVTITYQEPTSSPLLRWLLGDTYTTTAQAASWSQ